MFVQAFAKRSVSEWPMRPFSPTFYSGAKERKERRHCFSINQEREKKKKTSWGLEKNTFGSFSGRVLVNVV